jgi:hypothetical protein
MDQNEAFEKIMKAADQYAAWVQHMEFRSNEVGPFSILTDEYKKAEKKAKTYRWELEQMIKAALFAVANGGE